MVQVRILYVLSIKVIFILFHLELKKETSHINEQILFKAIIS